MFLLNEFRHQPIFGMLYYLDANKWALPKIDTKEFKEGNRGSLWALSHNDRHLMDASYCTLGFGMIIRQGLRILSLQHDSPHD